MGDGRYLFVPLDHSVSDGPVVPARWDDLLRALVAGGADAVIVHKGRARAFAPDSCRLRAGGPPERQHRARRRRQRQGARRRRRGGRCGSGADAVSVHVNIGSDTEAGS